MIRRVPTILAAAALFAGCGASDVAVPGTYEAKITFEDVPSGLPVSGEWTLRLTDDGKWSLFGRSTGGRYMQTSGDYAVSGNELTILSDVVCGPGHAVFRWRLDGDALHLDPVREECQQIRTAHLTAKPWTKVG